MEEIEIVQIKIGVGFCKSNKVTFHGIIFDNGKIAYLNESEDVCTAYNDDVLIKPLKQESRCIDAYIVYQEESDGN